MIASMRTWFQLQCMQAVEEKYSVNCQILKIGNVLNELGKEPQLVAWNIDNDVVSCHLRKIWGSGCASVKCIGVLWCSHRLGRETDSNWDQNVGFAISSMDVPCMIVYFLSSYEINIAMIFTGIISYCYRTWLTMKNFRQKSAFIKSWLALSSNKYSFLNPF